MDVLPLGWAKGALAEVAECQLGKMLDKGKRIKGTPLPYLRNVNVRWERIDFNDLLEMPFADDELERYGLKDNDILVCEGGEPGRAAIWKYGDTNVKYQKAIHRVRLHDGIEPMWLVYALRRDSLFGNIVQYFSGTTIKHFTGLSLKRYVLPLPPTREQRRIVAKIEALMARI